MLAQYGLFCVYTRKPDMDQKTADAMYRQIVPVSYTHLQMLKKIASAARMDCEELLGARVNLQCWVKVREDWRDKMCIRDRTKCTERSKSRTGVCR